MKTFILTLVTLLSLSIGAYANEYVPDTSKISSETEYVILNEGSSEDATPMWISKNPTCYTKQVLKIGVYEAWIDNEENIVYVYKDGVEVKKVILQGE